jgi:hypothetical protein
VVDIELTEREMVNLRIRHRLRAKAPRSAFARAAVVSLTAVIAALAYGVADSRPAPGGAPSGFGAEGAGASVLAEISGRVRIVVRFRTSTGGTFVVSGAISDSGRFTAVRRVMRGRVQVTEVLAGRLGTLRIRTSRRCAQGSGTWQALSGSKAYAGVSGGGAARGGPRCAQPTYPVQAVYTGTLQTPPPPPPPVLAQPGQYGGGTSQREEVVVAVNEGGRTFSGLRLSVTVACTGTPITTRVFASFLETYEIAADRSFSLRLESSPASGTRTVTGRFTSLTTVEGTAAVTTTLTTSTATYPCAGNVTWTASLPPPAATPGKYCGVTGQGPSICLDVGPDGREVVSAEVGVVVSCQPSAEFEVRVTFTAARIGGHLGVFKNVSSFEGLVSGSGRISGLFDLNGPGASGTVNLLAPTFDHEGNRYSCRSGASSWTARLQG